MAPSNIVDSLIVDSLYERTASFGRHVVHYIVTGTIFAFVTSVPWWSKLDVCQTDDIALISGNVRVQIVFLFIAVIALFGVGHVLLAMRQHLVTKTNFLTRVVVAFRMSEQTHP